MFSDVRTPSNERNNGLEAHYFRARDTVLQIEMINELRVWTALSNPYIANDVDNDWRYAVRFWIYLFPLFMFIDPCVSLWC